MGEEKKIVNFPLKEWKICLKLKGNKRTTTQVEIMETSCVRVLKCSWSQAWRFLVELCLTCPAAPGLSPSWWTAQTEIRSSVSPQSSLKITALWLLHLSCWALCLALSRVAVRTAAWDGSACCFGRCALHAPTSLRFWVLLVFLARPLGESTQGCRKQPDD